MLTLKTRLEPIMIFVLLVLSLKVSVRERERSIIRYELTPGTYGALANAPAKRSTLTSLQLSRLAGLLWSRGILSGRCQGENHISTLQHLHANPSRRSSGARWRVVHSRLQFGASPPHPSSPRKTGK